MGMDFNPNVSGAGKIPGAKDVGNTQNIANNELPVKPPEVDSVSINQSAEPQATTPEQVTRAVGAEVASYPKLLDATRKLLFGEASKDLSA